MFCFHWQDEEVDYCILNKKPEQGVSVVILLLDFKNDVWVNRILFLCLLAYFDRLIFPLWSDVDYDSLFRKIGWLNFVLKKIKFVSSVWRYSSLQKLLTCCLKFHLCLTKMPLPWLPSHQNLLKIKDLRRVILLKVQRRLTKIQLAKVSLAKLDCMCFHCWFLVSVHPTVCCGHIPGVPLG